MKECDIMKSILDTDLYKLSMQMAVLELFPDVDVEYKFTNRGNNKFTQEFVDELQNKINSMNGLILTEMEYQWLKINVPYFNPMYLEYLKNYKFQPCEVGLNLSLNNDLEIIIKGKWHSTIFWEVPLMSMISELYFDVMDTDWSIDINSVMAKQTNLADVKRYQLANADCYYADFGTRRRRSYEIQENFVKVNAMSKDSHFVGTSNVYLAMKFGIKPIGSVAHEWTQAMQSLNSLNHCNYYAMENWVKVYSDVQIGTALTDTVGTDMFLKDFNRKLSMLYPSVRHDSGCAFTFTDKIIKHYEKMGINPTEKTIIFSDGLTVDKAIEIKKYCDGKIKCSFGIGTHFSNDGFKDSPSLNMVIKLWNVNGLPVVKLSDVNGKANGDPYAVEYMRWVVKNYTKKVMKGIV